MTPAASPAPDAIKLARQVLDRDEYAPATARTIARALLTLAEVAAEYLEAHGHVQDSLTGGSLTMEEHNAKVARFEAAETALREALAAVGQPERTERA